MSNNNRKGTDEEIQELVSAIRESSEPIAQEIEDRLIQHCSCAAAVWNLASSTDPVYLRTSVATIEDVEQKKRVISDNLSHVLDFVDNMQKSCWIGFPVIEPHLEKAKSAYENDDFEKYISSLQDMHMALGMALSKCYGAVRD